MEQTISIQEGNKLIAELDELLRDKDAYADGTFGYRWKDNYTYHLDQLQYHSSWDWLMPVVEKIRNDHFVNIEIYGDYTAVWIVKDRDLPKHEQQIYSQDKEMISAVYGAVVQFIQWYNNQK